MPIQCLATGFDGTCAVLVIGENFALSVLTCVILSFARLESFDTVSPSRFETKMKMNNFQLLLIADTLHLGRFSVSTSFATGSG